jgi:hypothetical protein
MPSLFSSKNVLLRVRFSPSDVDALSTEKHPFLSFVPKKLNKAMTLCIRSNGGNSLDAVLELEHLQPGCLEGASIDKNDF